MTLDISTASLPQLQQATALMRDVLNSVAEGVVVLAPDGQLIESNPAASRILGLSRAEISLRTPHDPRWEAVHEDGGPFPSDEHPGPASLRTGLPVSNVVMGVRRGDGSLVWVRVNAVPLLNGDGRPYAVVSTFADITPEVSRAQTLAATATHLAAVLDGTRDASFQVDLATGSIAITPAFALTLGFGEEELGSSLDVYRALIHPDDQALGPVGLARLLTADYFDTEQRLRHRQGYWIRVRMRGKVAERDSVGRPRLLAGTCGVIGDEKPGLYPGIGLLPMCVHCKDIRDEHGTWERLERYLALHTGAEVSHGVCPDCMRKHYPEFSS